MNLHSFDTKIITSCKRVSAPFARFALFVLYFWFGFLKIVGLSPASGVVERLFDQTLASFLNFGTFLVFFGIFECFIGVLFLVRGAERIVLPLLFLHLVTTSGPLLFLPQEVWTGFLVPTLEGQYIIKNLALIAVAIGIAANLEPMQKRA